MGATSEPVPVLPSSPAPLPFLKYVRYVRYVAISTLVPCVALIAADRNEGYEAFEGARFLMLLEPVAMLISLEIELFVVRRIAHALRPLTWFESPAQEWKGRIVAWLMAFCLWTTFLASMAFWLIGAVAMWSLLKHH